MKAHKKDWVHSDFRPSLVQADQRVKLLMSGRQRAQDLWTWGGIQRNIKKTDVVGFVQVI